MLILLFGFIVGLSLILIVLGLIRPTESAQALIGFFLLFVMSILLMNGQVQYEVGANVTSSVTYNGDGTINIIDQTVDYNYVFFNDSTSHQIGLYLAIASGVGFAGILYSLKGHRVKEQ